MEDKIVDYSLCIQNTVEYINQHLFEQLTLDELSKVAGFSKYHFLRIYKNEMGMGIRDFIQMKRMHKAAQLLISSDLTVIDIAVIANFDSQEAFTRAFKREYSLPPAQYRRTMMKIINNKEFEKMHNQLIPGWIATGNMPRLYSAFIDSRTYYNGAKSIALKNKTDILEPGTFYTVMQQFKAEKFIGKRVRFSAFVKTEEVKELGCLWMRINSSTADILKIDNMQNRPIKGNTDWTYYSVVLDVPENSAIINIGVLLAGSGKLWASGLSFEIVDKSVPATDVDLSSGLPEGPINLSLDE